MTIAATETPTCPRCQKNPKLLDGTLCADCFDEEHSEASAGQEDARTQREAKQQLVPGGSNGAKPAVKPAPQQRPPVVNGKPAVRSDAQQRPAGGRMTLESIKTATEIPYRIIVYGVPGIGKSTMGADAPKPVFLAPELSSNIVAPKFPQPETWRDMIDAVSVLIDGAHDYETLVIDTADQAEPICWRQCIIDDNERKKRGAMLSRSIEDVGGGYMKGYVAAVQKWLGLLARLERLQERRGMNVVILAHAHVRNFNNPEGENWDTWEMKMHAKLGALLSEWSEAVLFANYLTKVETDRRGNSKRKGVSPLDGGRQLLTTRTASYYAKNRYGLPASLPLGWAEFDAAVQENRNPEALGAMIRDKLGQVEDQAIVSWVEEQLKAKLSVSKLTRINNKLAAKIEEIERKAEEAAEQAQEGAV